MKIRALVVMVAVLCTGALGQAPEKDKVVAGAERALEKAAKTNPMPAPGCAIGVSLNDVFRIVNEYSRETVESPVARVLREGQIGGDQEI